MKSPPARRLMEHCLEHAENVPGIKAEVITTWPTDRQRLQKVAAVVFSGDRFPAAEMPDGERVMADLKTMMDHGCGLVAVHYATGLAANHVSPNRRAPAPRLDGRLFRDPLPAPPIDRPRLSSSHDRTHRRRPSGAPRLEAIHRSRRALHQQLLRQRRTSQEPIPSRHITCPPRIAQAQIVAWAVSRDDGGRGVGIVMPHFYKNWHVDDMRMLIMNAIVWSAKRERPARRSQNAIPRPGPLRTSGDRTAAAPTKDKK